MASEHDADFVIAQRDEYYRRVLELKAELRLLVGFVATCRKENTDLWMSFLVKRINTVCEVAGDTDRVQFNGDGIVIDKANT